MHLYKTEQFLPVSKAKAWAFFSSPNNLALITPPEMEFKILGSVKDTGIYEGMKIDYSVKPLWGFPVHWQTEICKVDDKNYFTDRQLIGPYSSWEHTHTFLEKDGGVLMQDVVNYKIPLGPLGKLLNSLLIQRKIKEIFDYRRKVLETMFV